MMHGQRNIKLKESVLEIWVFVWKRKAFHVVYDAFAKCSQLPCFISKPYSRKAILRLLYQYHQIQTEVTACIRAAELCIQVKSFFTVVLRTFLKPPATR